MTPSTEPSEAHASAAQLLPASLTFPEKLMRILDDEIALEAIWWMPGNKTFAIQAEKFPSHVLDKFFQRTKYMSFVRKLNQWGFRRIPNDGTGAPGVVVYVHSLFQRGRNELLKGICDRKKARSKSSTLQAKQGTKVLQPILPSPELGTEGHGLSLSSSAVASSLPAALSTDTAVAPSPGIMQLLSATKTTNEASNVPPPKVDTRASYPGLASEIVKLLGAAKQEECCNAVEPQEVLKADSTTSLSGLGLNSEILNLLGSSKPQSNILELLNNRQSGNGFACNPSSVPLLPAAPAAAASAASIPSNQLDYQCLLMAVSSQSQHLNAQRTLPLQLPRPTETPFLISDNNSTSALILLKLLEAQNKPLATRSLF